MNEISWEILKANGYVRQMYFNSKWIYRQIYLRQYFLRKINNLLMFEVYQNIYPN